MSARARWAAAVALAGSLSGCGSQVDIAGNGGGGTSTTSTTNSASTSSANPVCPATQPGNGDACSPDGLACHYDEECGGADATCTGGSWWVQEYGVGCAAMCPTAMPKPGEPCSVCCLPPSCTFVDPTGCVTGGSCVNGAWQLSGPACPPPASCQAHADWSSCAQDPSCRWLTAGCTGAPPTFKDGCYPAQACLSDFDCGPYQGCKQIVYDPCFMKGCDSCSAPSTLCL